jgi:hypothetical protein
MSTLVLLLIFWTQGIPVQPTQGGTITGVLKDSAGKPAAGIRIGAVARPDSLEEFAGGAAAMSSLAETDDQGRYSLENVPPGRYFIAAGILSFPTYYPGTQAMAEGKTVLVTAGATVPGIDFTLKDSSGGRIIGTGGGQGIGAFAIPLDIRVENRGKTPIFGAGKPTRVRLEPVTGGNAITATVTDGSIPILPTSADYRISMEGLPNDYTVKSIKYGSADIKDGILNIAAGAGVSQTAQGITVFTFGNAIGNLANVVAGARALVLQTQSIVPQTLSIVLTRVTQVIPGVNVTGQFVPAIQGAFLSGISATIYLDRSFEVPGVQPGRHTMMAFSGTSNRTFAASIIVGNKDINGVELEETSALPLNGRTPTPPGPAGNRPPGKIPLAAVRGKIVDGETGELLTQGDVYLVGDYWTGHPLTADGKFEFRSLLPGRYQIEVKAVGYPTFQKEFSIDEQDMELELKSN